MNCATPSNREEHKKNALYGDEETRKADVTVRESVRHERVLAELEELVSQVAGFCVRAYEDFRMWDAQRDAAWAADPDQYDEEEHSNIVEISDLWVGVFRRLANLIDRVEALGGHIDDTKVREHYQAMLSIETMIHGPMPEHIRQAAREAEADFLAGRTKEIDL